MEETKEEVKLSPAQQVVRFMDAIKKMPLFLIPPFMEVNIDPDFKIRHYTDAQKQFCMSIRDIKADVLQDLMVLKLKKPQGEGGVWELRECLMPMPRAMEALHHVALFGNELHSLIV